MLQGFSVLKVIMMSMMMIMMMIMIIMVMKDCVLCEIKVMYFEPRGHYRPTVGATNAK